MKLNQKQLNNFWNKVQKTDNCWLWKGHKSKGGYGKVNINCKAHLAHRISCIIANKLIDATNTTLGASGTVVMHTCDNRICVNPNHLIVGTQKDNMLDAKNKGRKWYGEMAGENHPKSKLDWIKVFNIRNSVDSAIKLSKLYGIDRSQIYLIRKNKSWITA